MKYVFYVPNHIAFYIALQIQDFLKLNNSEIRYISIRNYKNNYHELDYVLDLTEYYYKLNKSSLNLKEAINLLNDIDKKIKDLTDNDDYEFIVFSLKMPYCQFIATNPKCKRLYISEEGSGSYRDNPTLYFSGKNSLKNKLIKSLKKLISSDFRTYCKRAPDYPPLNPEPLFKDVIYFTLYEEAFPLIPKSKKIIFGQIYKDPQFKTDVSFDNSIIIIFDALLVEQMRFMQSQEYLDFIIPFFEKILYENQKIYYKLHPEQNHEIQNVLSDILQNQYQATKIDNSIPIEQIIVHFKNLKFYGFMSSLLFYAKRHGHFVQSFLENTDNPKIKQFISDFFDPTFKKEIFKLQ